MKEVLSQVSLVLLPQLIGLPWLIPKQKQCKGVAQLSGHLMRDGVCQYFIVHLVIIKQAASCTCLFEGPKCLPLKGTQICKASGSLDMAQQQADVVAITLTCIGM